MNNVLNFTDFGFKLAIIEILMYEKNILPKISAVDLIRKNRNITKKKASEIFEESAYDIIPEVLKACQDVEITADMVQDIEEIYTCGGSEIYHQLMRYWDGEGDEFNVNSANDTDLIPNLKKMTLLYNEDLSLDDFRDKDIEADWL